MPDADVVIHSSPMSSLRPPSVLALAFAALLFAACGSDDGSGGRGGVEFFPAGGVSEDMRDGNVGAKLGLIHTVVAQLESAGDHPGDTGSEPGVDEFPYHFAEEREVRLSVDEFDETPTLIALDATGAEVARVDAESGDSTFTASGDYTLRFVHPRAGDATAEPILIFFRPILPETPDANTPGGSGGQDPNDVATLKAGKSCVRCNLKGLSWNVCDQAVSLQGINLSHADFSSSVLACQVFEPKGNTPLLLSGAVFDSANLSELTFSGVDLTDASFKQAMFDVTTFNNVTATAADFEGIRFSNSIFGATTGSGSTARGANFRSAQIIENSCLSTYDLRDADFTDATFDSTSSVHGTWFAGANLFGATFDGTRFQHDSVLPNCGQPSSCTTVTAAGCSNCPCTADLGCLTFSGDTACVQNQGAITLSGQNVCQRPTEQETAKGIDVTSADLLGISFNGADLTNSVFASNMLDKTNDFAGADLSGVDFTKQDLGKAVDLSKSLLSATTNFTGATLTNADAMEGVNLSCIRGDGTGGCDLGSRSAQFKGADMQYATLNDVGLVDADLTGVNLSNASLVGANLSFAGLAGAKLIGTTLGVATGSGGGLEAGNAAILNGAYMINVDMTDVDARSVDFTQAHLYGTTTNSLFVRALLDSADFTGAILAGGVFTNASMDSATFNQAQLVNTSFSGATLDNTKFDGAYLQGADFSTAASVDGMTLANAGVSTNLTSTKCTLTPPGEWTFMEQDGTPYPFQYGVTLLQTDDTVTCPDTSTGPCTTGDSLCPIDMGPNPPQPPCVPVQQYCFENCLDPPCYQDTPNSPGGCPLIPTCG